jgi:Predicted dehydrogenases and related proteins
MLGGGIHMIDLSMWLTNQRPVEVFAWGNGISTRSSGFSGRDFAVALVKFSTGLVAKISANFGSVTPHHHRVSVYGTAGTFIHTHGLAQYIDSRTEDSVPTGEEHGPIRLDKGLLIEDFVDAVVEPATVQRQALDTLAVAEVGLAIESSLERGIPVQIGQQA